ncbi:MAG: DUF5642 family protein, partial [Mycobacteriaceae bacterium]|nr:DUF5642 family protein [Mycobacteriaceae bacterium]
QPCATLADPVGDNAPSQGLAASGPGGIIYAVVTGPASPHGADAAADCPRWAMSGGRTTATVDLVAAPAIDAVPTVGMTTASHTVVEGGTATDSQIETVTAYLGDYVAFVVVVTDPGAPHAPLQPDLAGTLLGKAVATLRG